MMTVSADARDEPIWTSSVPCLDQVPEAFRESSTMGLRGFGPKRDIVDVTSELTCSETRLLNVFKRLAIPAGRSVTANLLWASWRMFGDEAALTNTVERLKHRRLIAAGEGRWGLCLTDAGFAILVSL